MIAFDLKCPGGHVFEAWFASSTAYDDQRDRGLVACPACGSTGIDKAVMAPNIAAKGNRAPTPAQVKAALATMAVAQAKMLESSTWVGKGFAEQARAMHAGERDTEVIHGQATRAEAKALIDDGIPVAPLPLPVVPPEQTH